MSAQSGPETSTATAHDADHTLDEWRPAGGPSLFLPLTLPAIQLFPLNPETAPWLSTQPRGCRRRPASSARPPAAERACACRAWTRRSHTSKMGTGPHWSRSAACESELHLGWRSAPASPAAPAAPRAAVAARFLACPPNQPPNQPQHRLLTFCPMPVQLQARAAALAAQHRGAHGGAAAGSGRPALAISR